MDYMFIIRGDIMKKVILVLILIILLLLAWVSIIQKEEVDVNKISNVTRKCGRRRFYNNFK